MRYTQFGEGKTDRQKERLWDGSFPMTRSQSTLHTLRLRNEKREKKRKKINISQEHFCSFDLLEWKQIIRIIDSQFDVSFLLTIFNVNA